MENLDLNMTAAVAEIAADGSIMFAGIAPLLVFIGGILLAFIVGENLMRLIWRTFRNKLDL